MKGLKTRRFVYHLYVTERDRFIGTFESFECAAAFAKKYYPNIASHVEPAPVLTFEEEKKKS